MVQSKIITPSSADEIKQYYQIRFEELRKPWNQPIGSERDSIEDDNPVVFLESLALYDKKDEVPEEYIKNPLGKAEIKKKGKDITIICWGYTVYQSLEAATNLFEKYNIDVEVIDLKTLYIFSGKLSFLLSKVKSSSKFSNLFGGCFNRSTLISSFARCPFFMSSSVLMIL